MAKNVHKSYWPIEPLQWATECKKLLIDSSSSHRPAANLKEVLTRSRNFPINYPTIHPTCQYLKSFVPENILERNIKSSYPVIHEYALNLYARFLLHKKANGSDIERDFYSRMTVPELIDRLLLKRAVMFMCPSDEYLLMDKTSGTGDWEKIGKSKTGLLLDNCLSYDEIKLSALLSVSCYSYFINNGVRSNNGVVEQNREHIQEEGVVVGVIGTRLEKQNVMEYQELVVTKAQNTFENGYGNDQMDSIPKLFFDFYQCKSFDYKDVKEQIDKEDNERFVALPDGLFFDNVMYARRLAISFDTLLVEANHRAKERNLDAYIHVVGIGLGVWKLSSHQQPVFVQTFLNRISAFGHLVSNVSDVHFAYFSNLSQTSGYKHGDLIPIEGHKNGGVRVHISKREPFTKLPETGKLLVVSYAWDGNALPGNEFWEGMLGATGDSATAASSQIAELQNPHINNMVCHENLMVATLKGTLVPFNEYITRL